MAVKLSKQETRARLILVGVAQGRARTPRVGYISYKGLWRRLSTKKWGRARVRPIIEIITNISAYELQHGRPPLNELVVPTNRSTPTEGWNGIRQYLKKKSGKTVPYSGHEMAQQACWNHWRRKDGNKAQSLDEAEEGYQGDRTVKFRKRNRSLIQACKKRDKNNCQACKFRLPVDGKFIVDCHHKYPLGYDENVRVTRLTDLVCLCPTCHRIAHTRKHPLGIEEIRKARGLAA